MSGRVYRAFTVPPHAYALDNEELRGVLDSGHRRDGAVIRTVGDNPEPARFSTFCPVAAAAISRLPGTIEERSIKIAMRRRRPEDKVLSLRFDRAGKFDGLARQIARWTRDHAKALTLEDPEMPPGIYNRAADNWRPLFAVVDLAGGSWPQRARTAALSLTGESEVLSVRELLLRDLRELFDREASGALAAVACTAVLDRAFGKPHTRQPDQVETLAERLAAMTPEQRRADTEALIARARARLAEAERDELPIIDGETGEPSRSKPSHRGIISSYLKEKMRRTVPIQSSTWGVL